MKKFIDLVVSDGVCYAIYMDENGLCHWEPQTQFEYGHASDPEKPWTEEPLTVSVDCERR